MTFPHRIATLVYVFNSLDEVLLVNRRREPNRGLWSPIGGKLETENGESPHQCACRETREEIGLRLGPSDLHLVGLVSEHGYEGEAHWLMFLFEAGRRLRVTPPAGPEGEFAFVGRDELEALALPATDCLYLWPMFWKHRGGFFAGHIRCDGPDSFHWTLEESLVISGDGTRRLH